jgi:hypothetical protein
MAPLFKKGGRLMTDTINHWSDGRVELPPTRVGSKFGPAWHELRERIVKHNRRPREERVAVPLKRLATYLGVPVGCIVSELSEDQKKPQLGPRLGPQLLGRKGKRPR